MTRPVVKNGLKIIRCVVGKWSKDGLKSYLKSLTAASFTVFFAGCSVSTELREHPAARFKRS